MKFKRNFRKVVLLFAVSMLITLNYSTAANAADTSNIGTKLADYIMKQWPDPDTITNKQWEYTNGIVLYGIDKIYEKTGNKVYFNYVRTFVDKYVDNNGVISPIRPPHTLDVIQPSNLLFTLYKETNEPKYFLAMTNTRNMYKSFPVTPEGGFWHKTNYPNQMWLDGIYMAEPFIARYGKVYGNKLGIVGEEKTCYDTATFQIKLVAQHTLDPNKKLCYHAWDASKLAAWANHTTGVSPEIWSRAMGWYAMALVDTLEYLPREHEDYQALKSILKTIAEGLKNTQDAKTGLWYQVIDKGSLPDNWIETSGSAMFIYALEKAAIKGYIPLTYHDVANKAWEGLKANMITLNADGSVVVKDTVEGMGVQVDYANYVNKTKGDNVPHGMAAVLMAASVMEY